MEVGKLRIKTNFPEGYDIDFPLNAKRLTRSGKKYPDIYQAHSLWLCPVCAHIVINVPSYIED